MYPMMVDLSKRKVVVVGGGQDRYAEIAGIDPLWCPRLSSRLPSVPEILSGLRRSKVLLH